MTPRLPFVIHLLVASLLLSLACASTPGDSASRAPSLSGRHVVVAPLNLGIRRAESLDQKSAAVGRELLAFLESSGAEVSVLSHEDALEMWEDAHGASSAKTHDIVSRGFAREVASAGDFDLLVMPSVVIRGARVTAGHAHWDGVRRTLEVGHPVVDPLQAHGHSEVQVNHLKGSVAGASLHVVTLDVGGSVLFQGLAGLDLMQKAELEGTRDKGEWRLEAVEEPLRDLDHLREGIEMAFERKLPRTARSW